MPWEQWEWDGSVTPDGLAFGETEDQLVQPVLCACIKEPRTHFRVSEIPGDPVNLDAGQPKNFTLRISRVCDPRCCQTPVTNIKLEDFDNCVRLDGVGGGVNITSIWPNIGPPWIVNRGGNIWSAPPHWPVPTLFPPTPTNITFTADFPLPDDGRRDRCRYLLAADPYGEVVEWALDDHEITFKEPGVGGAVELFVDSSEPSARAAESGGAASFPLPAMAGIAAVAAIATVALAAGGWYARRRLS